MRTFLSTKGQPCTIHLVDASPNLFASASGFAAGFLTQVWVGLARLRRRLGLIDELSANTPMNYAGDIRARGSQTRGGLAEAGSQPGRGGSFGLPGFGDKLAITLSSSGKTAPRLRSKPFCGCHGATWPSQLQG